MSWHCGNLDTSASSDTRSFTCSITTSTSTKILPPNSTSMIQMFRVVATGLFLSLSTPRLTSRLAFTHGLAHRAARRLAHALDRADGADNIQSVDSCQVARQVAGSVPLQLGGLGFVSYPGTRKARFLSMNLFLVVLDITNKPQLTKPHSLIHPQSPTPPLHKIFLPVGFCLRLRFFAFLSSCMVPDKTSS